MSHTPYSKPQTQRIGRYPLLCLDIDGVCAPVGQNPRFHCHGWPPGFVDCGRSVQIHPALPRWVGELEVTFETICWISSWAYRCSRFAESAGLPSAMTWDYVDTDLSAEAQTGIGRKLGGLAEVIDPAARSVPGSTRSATMSPRSTVHANAGSSIDVVRTANSTATQTTTKATTPSVRFRTGGMPDSTARLCARRVFRASPAG